MTLLKDRGVTYTYREYSKDPLSEAELRHVLGLLGIPERTPIKAVFRKNDSANRALALTGSEPFEELVAAMVDNPTLLQRPIGIVGDRAVVGRPPEALLELL